MLKERELAVNNSLAAIDVMIALVTFNFTAYFLGNQSTGTHNRDLIILNLLTIAIWFILSKRFRLGELYRSRPYSIVLFNCAGLSFFGSSILALAAFVLNIPFATTLLLGVYLVLNLVVTFVSKLIIYQIMKSFRKQGLNSRMVIIKGDKSAIPFIREILEHNEWGYRITAIVGDINSFKEFVSVVPVFSPENINIDELISQRAIDELIYCKAKPNMDEMESLLYSCNEVGVIFRMYSPFFNMLTNKTHLHYFNTHGLLTFSNTPQDYLSLKAKRIFDFLVSFLVILLFSPLYLAIAIAIKATSKGPVFFKQVRVGLRGRRFWVYKFRTMVTNAEELKDKLLHKNEMDGPVFKITNDPRITGVGNFLRRTSLDELPQFFNVFLGQMSIVGPRPPIPPEVKEYERWQLRRMSMKPGITCLWQISPSRNDISFEDWMRMDLEYIDNWSLKLDFVIVLKTVRAIVRADGK